MFVCFRLAQIQNASYFPVWISCVSHSINICTVTIKNVGNIHAVSTNQIPDILHFNDKQ